MPQVRRPSWSAWRLVACLGLWTALAALQVAAAGLAVLYLPWWMAGPVAIALVAACVLLSARVTRWGDPPSPVSPP